MGFNVKFAVPVGDSNRTATDAPVELILLRLGVWRLVVTVAVLIDFHDYWRLPSALACRRPECTEESLLAKPDMDIQPPHGSIF